MNYDKDKVDEMALALLYLSSFKEKPSYAMSAWKSFDWETMNRLHEKGYISNPKNKNKSITLSEEGEKLSQQLFQQYFGSDSSNKSIAAPAKDSQSNKSQPAKPSKSSKSVEPDEQPIYLINRNVAFLRAKQPYLDWLLELEIPELEVTLADLQRDGTTMLIPEVETAEEAMEYIETVYEDLFEIELAAWSQDDEQWPEDLTWELFNEWFEVEIHSMVIDLADDEIEKEDFL